MAGSFVCVLYFSAACDSNAVRNLSMVTAQHLFLFKERKRFGFSARISTQVITLLPAEFPCSFNCSSHSSLPLLKSANADLLLCFGNAAVVALLRQVKWPHHASFRLDLPLVKIAASNCPTLQLSSFCAWLWHNKLVLLVILLDDSETASWKPMKRWLRAKRKPYGERGISLYRVISKSVYVFGSH